MMRHPVARFTLYVLSVILLHGTLHAADAFRLQFTWRIAITDCPYDSVEALPSDVVAYLIDPRVVSSDSTTGFKEYAKIDLSTMKYVISDDGGDVVSDEGSYKFVSRGSDLYVEKDIQSTNPIADNLAVMELKVKTTMTHGLVQTLRDDGGNLQTIIADASSGRYQVIDATAWASDLAGFTAMYHPIASAAPEPSGGVLIWLGVAGLVLRRKRQV